MSARYSSILMVVFLGLVFDARASDSPRMFVVDMRVVSNGAAIMTPRVTVPEGQDASVGRAGPEDVAVGLILSDAGNQQVHVLAEVEAPAGRISPDLTVLLGEWTSMTEGAVGFEIRVH